MESGLLPPGYQDVRTRIFTFDGGDPVLAQPRDEDLNRIALFAPIFPGYWDGVSPVDFKARGSNYGLFMNALAAGGGGYDDGIWAEKRWINNVLTDSPGFIVDPPWNWGTVERLGPDGPKLALAWWRQALALGGLPEDEEFFTGPSHPAYDWPTKGSNQARQIYFWRFDNDESGKAPTGKLKKVMQLQKFDVTDGHWRVFNKWGHDLTFEWDPTKEQWTAGFDFGRWWVDHRGDIANAVTFAASALITVLSFGTGAGVGAAIGAALAAQSACIEGMKKLVSGDIGGAWGSFQKMAGNLSQIPISADGAMQIPKELTNLIANDAFKEFSKVVAFANTTDPSKLIRKAWELGGAGKLFTEVNPLTKEIERVAATKVMGQAKALIEPQLRAFFNKGSIESLAADFGRGTIPWYAQSAFDFGATMSSAAVASTLTDVQLSIVETPASVRDRLITRIRNLQKKYGISHLELESRRADLKARGYTDEQLKQMGYG